MTNSKLRHIGIALTLAGAFTLSTGAYAGSGMLDFKTMDKNGDGKLSPEEHEECAKKMFETMDANKDGNVTAAEMDAAHETIAGKKAHKGEMTSADKIKTIDTNNDGQVSADEHAAGSRKMFGMMDTDHDGAVNKTEMTTGHKKMMKPASK